MARIVLTRALRRFAEGQAEFDLEVSTVHELFRELGRRYPPMQPHLEQGIAVAINGQIYQDAFLEPLQPDSEVFFMQRIEGG